MTQIPNILPDYDYVPNAGWTKDAATDFANKNTPFGKEKNSLGEFDLLEPGGGGGFSQGGDFQGEYEGGGFEDIQPSTEKGGAYVDEEEEKRRKYYEELQDEEQGSTGNKWLLWAAIGIGLYAILKR